jgi:tetratricopeptide (TPR) repeat protein
MFNSNDYAKGKAYRSDKMREATRDHLAKQAQSDTTNPFDFETFLYAHRRAVIVVVLVVLAALLTLALPDTSRAHDLAESGDNEPFAPAIQAYRVGHYYYVSGQYEKAIEQYALAIDGIPAVVFEKAENYRVMHWDMGDARLMAGQHDEALASYRRFLELMDGAASAEAVEFVERLEESIARDMVNLTPLAG